MKRVTNEASATILEKTREVSQKVTRAMRTRSRTLTPTTTEVKRTSTRSGTGMQFGLAYLKSKTQPTGPPYITSKQGELFKSKSRFMRRRLT